MKQEAAGNRDETCGEDQKEFRRGRVFTNTDLISSPFCMGRMLMHIPPLWEA